MFFRCLSAVAVASLMCSAQTAGTLRVCADPHNMPLSSEGGQGMENKLAELVGSQLGLTVQYVWTTQNKSFIKKSINEGKCDVLMGVPSSLDSVAVTRPYYRSSYVFVSQSARNLQLLSLMDPKLSQLSIGMNVVGEDYAPPAFLLARQGITKIVPFVLPGDPRTIVDAVDDGGIDVAIVWGPFAGYFAKLAKSPLLTQPVSPTAFGGVPFTFDISMAVRKDNEILRAKLDGLIRDQSAAIQQILSEYGVPQVH